MPEINNDALTVHPFHRPFINIRCMGGFIFLKKIKKQNYQRVVFCTICTSILASFFLSKNRAICLTYYSQIIIRNAIKCRRLWPLRTEAHPLGLRYDGAFYPLLCNRVPVRDGGSPTEKNSSSRIKGVQSM